MAISTADCKKALAAAWPLVFGKSQNPAHDASLDKLAGKWARVSKSGKKGEPIERLFFHDTLPVQALVVEKDGVIAETIIRGYAVYDCPEDGSEKEEAMKERACTNEATKLFQTYPLFRPSDFLFRVMDEDETDGDGSTWFELYPTVDFGRGRVFCCEHLENLIGRHLPQDASEIQEMTFATNLSTADCEAELNKRGFVKAENFVPTSRRSAGGGDEDE